MKKLSLAAVPLLTATSLLAGVPAAADVPICETTSESYVYSGTNYITETVTTLEECTWTVPTGVTSATVLIVGAGGGGGGGATTYVGRGGGGGGGGGDVGSNGFSGISAGQVWTVNVGAGGAGGTGGLVDEDTGADIGGIATDGADGEASSLRIGVTTYSSSGGFGGSAGSNVGGVGGNSGESGRVGGSNSGLQGGSGGSYESSGSSTTAINTGNTQIQFSATSVTYVSGGGGGNATQFGSASSTPGSGGGGGRGSLNLGIYDYGYNGSAGKDGAVLIRYQNPLAAPDGPGTPSAVGGDTEATVTWTAAAGGETPDSYVVTATPGGATCEVDHPTLSCTVTGLVNGTEYTFTVEAINDGGSSGNSSPSAAITLLAVPGEPTGISAEASSGEATITWSHPTGGGEPDTYLVTSYPGGLTCEVDYPATSCTIEGLENGVNYYFTVTAENIRGQSPESDGSNTVTPTSGSSNLAPAKPYVGPVGLSVTQQLRSNAKVAVSGQRLSSVSAITLSGREVKFSLLSNGSIEITVPNVPTGDYKLEFHVPDNNLILTVDVSVVGGNSASNVGTFNGYIAVYAKGYKGATLSWKIAGKWFKTTVIDDYQVFKRRTAAVGVPVNVEVFVNGVKQLSKKVTTR